jgi:hypothetical protein
VKRLAREWAWAELHEQWFDERGFARSDDRQAAGAIVLLKWDGTVDITEGLLKPEPAAQELPDEEELEVARVENEARQQEQAARNLAAREFGLLIRDTGTTGSMGAVRAVLRMALVGIALNDGPLFLSTGDDGENADAFLDMLGTTQAELDDKVGAEGGGYPSAFVYRLWQAAGRMTDEQIMRALAAAALGPRGPWVHTTGVHADTATMARAMGLGIPAILQGDQADLEDAVAEGAA